jgi:hypothetical protein
LRASGRLTMCCAMGSFNWTFPIDTRRHFATVLGPTAEMTMVARRFKTHFGIDPTTAIGLPGTDRQNRLLRHLRALLVHYQNDCLHRSWPAIQAVGGGMKPLALLSICLLTACHPADKSDCAGFTANAPYTSPDLTSYERDSLEVTGLGAAYASGWTCGFSDGRNW